MRLLFEASPRARKNGRLRQVIDHAVFGLKVGGWFVVTSGLILGDTSRVIAGFAFLTYLEVRCRRRW